MRLDGPRIRIKENFTTAGSVDLRHYFDSLKDKLVKMALMAELRKIPGMKTPDNSTPFSLLDNALCFLRKQGDF